MLSISPIHSIELKDNELKKYSTTHAPRFLRALKLIMKILNLLSSRFNLVIQHFLHLRKIALLWLEFPSVDQNAPETKFSWYLLVLWERSICRLHNIQIFK